MDVVYSGVTPSQVVLCCYSRNLIAIVIAENVRWRRYRSTPCRKAIYFETCYRRL